MIFDQTTLNQLKRLQLVTREVKAGSIRGNRRSTQRGQSIEFADFRDYVPGDDLRKLDWKILARHDQAFMKLMENEEDIPIYILIDGSRSMNWGEGDQNKLTYSRRLAAGLGVMSLFTGDQLYIDVLGTHTSLGPIRGQGNLIRLFETLEHIQVGKELDLYSASLEFNAIRKRPGLLILITDLYFPKGYQDGIKRFQEHGHEVILFHTLSPKELSPELTGELQLVDSETGEPQEVNIDPSILKIYSNRLSAWQHEIRTFCNHRQIRLFPTDTSMPWDHFLLYEMRKMGLVI